MDNVWRWTAEIPEFDGTPLGLSAWLLQLLKCHFSRNSNQFKYSENQLDTKLLIDLHQQWSPNNCENYPGIYIKRGDWNEDSQFKTIGDIVATLEDSLMYKLWKPVIATMQIIMLGKEYGEIEKLANETWWFLNVFKDPILRNYSFRDMTVQRMSGIELAKEEKGYRICSLDLTFRFQLVYKIQVEKAVIKKVRIDV